MARPEDIQRANRLKEIEKEIAELQKGTSSDALARQPQINKLKRESLELSKEIQETDEKIVTSRKAQAKIGQQTLKIEKELDRTESLINKSISTRVSQLMKGNIAGALGLGQARKHELAQRSLAKEHKEQADLIKASTLDQSKKTELLDIASQVQAGILTTEEDINDAIKEAGGEGVKNLSLADKLLESKNAEAAAGAASAKNIKMLARSGAIVGGIFAALLAVAQKFAASVDAIGKQFGSLNVLSDEFKGNLMDAEMEVAGIGATMEDVVATTSALAGEFGISATDAADLSAQVIDTAKAVGLSNEEAAKLSGILQTTSGLSAEQAEQLTEGAFQLAVANNVAPDAVMRDLAGSAEEFAMFSKDGGDNLARAAVQARSMGLSLSDTAKIAEGLLNFQDSITKEVEASVLIGRQLNLQKAREAALAEDMVGMNEAIVEQLGSQDEFNKLGMIQRKALADALNTDVANLAKMVANQEKANDLAGETAKSFQDIIGKEAMSELTATMNELKVFGVALANTLGPLLMGVAKLVNMLLVPLGNMVVGISSAFRGGFGGASMDDGVVGPGGISMMAGSAGVFKLNPRDSVMATTNPIPVNDIRTGPPGSMGGGTNVQISSKMVKLGGGDLGLMVDAYTYPKNAGQGRTAFDSLTSRG